MVAGFAALAAALIGALTAALTAISLAFQSGCALLRVQDTSLKMEVIVCKIIRFSIQVTSGSRELPAERGREIEGP